MVNEVKSNSETTVSCQHNMQINANKLDTKNTRAVGGSSAVHQQHDLALGNC